MRTAAPLYSPDGEPLCAPAALSEPARLSEAARRLLPTIEAELRRRLSGSDRSIEVQELERHLTGVREAQAPLSPHGDPLLEGGLWSLCAGGILGQKVALPLDEVLAILGCRVSRGALPLELPPRALSALRAGLPSITAPHDPPDALELIRTRLDPQSPAVAVQIALAAAGLSRPVLLIAPEDGALRFLCAGLAPATLELVKEAAAPHPVRDAAPHAEELRQALRGRNPYLLCDLRDRAWPAPSRGDRRPPPSDADAGPQAAQPQLSAAGAALLEQVLGTNPPGVDDAAGLVLSCLAIAEAARLAHLSVPVHHSDSGGRPLPPEAMLSAGRTRLAAALQRLTARPVEPGQDGEAPLLLLQAARALESGQALLETPHPEEVGRLLCPVPGGYARLRLLGFPKDPPRALRVDDRPLFTPSRNGHGHGNGHSHPTHAVDGGDLRAELTLHPTVAFSRP